MTVLLPATDPLHLNPTSVRQRHNPTIQHLPPPVDAVLGDNPTRLLQLPYGCGGGDAAVILRTDPRSPARVVPSVVDDGFPYHVGFSPHAAPYEQTFDHTDAVARPQEARP